MNFIFVVDSFPPTINSAAVQMHDLSSEMGRIGHDLTVFCYDSNANFPYTLEILNGHTVIRVKRIISKDKGNILRSVSEAMMPFLMIYSFILNRSRIRACDGIIWYAPSIFHGPFIKFLKLYYKCKTYLILRDIFPNWALDLGLIRQGVSFWILSIVARFQYKLADIIGVQSPGNVDYLNKIYFNKSNVEVLCNWLNATPDFKNSFDLANTNLAGRRVLIYSGNMGAAQGLGRILKLASYLRDDPTIGFLFVGDGSERYKLEIEARHLKLNNVLFHGHVSVNELNSIYRQCVAGIVCLDPRHKSHNIPGKFLSYLRMGLPVFASINQNNDIVELIRDNRLGVVASSVETPILANSAKKLLDMIKSDQDISTRCRSFFQSEYSSDRCAKQILHFFENK